MLHLTSSSTEQCRHIPSYSYLSEYRFLGYWRTGSAYIHRKLIGLASLRAWAVPVGARLSSRLAHAFLSLRDTVDPGLVMDEMRWPVRDSRHPGPGVPDPRDRKLHRACDVLSVRFRFCAGRCAFITTQDFLYRFLQLSYYFSFSPTLFQIAHMC